MISFDGTYGDEDSQSLVHHNDVDMWTFKQIADYIRENPALFFHPMKV
jgi:hypothetical protein